MYRNQGGNRWFAKALVFTTATTAGGVAAGATLGFIGSSVPIDVRVASAAALSLAALIVGASEALGRPAPLLQCDRETPQQWVHQGALRWALRNGLALGCGAFTRIGFWSWYAVPVGVFLLGRVDAGVALCGTYGLARGLGAWAFISIGGVLRRRGVPFDDLALWALGRQGIARAIGGAALVLIGVATAGMVGL